ncbi:hypothetical protein KIL84_018257 [Mauremys mutica]|uniref:Macroglobulin domain-containing protein n=1 Tax=Mauremys mutica TaxID=74926 RepID=A0A9D3XSW4_9SAUR|nr:hypothetical protein KIL84_018257 [Mauremys mutica]
MPPVITILEEKFHLQVGGMYTYGKLVQGKVQAMVCRKPICYSWSVFKTNQDICREHSGQIKGEGCLAVMLDTKVYNLTLQNSYQFRLDAVASLEESGTGLEFNTTTQTCRVTSSIIHSSFWIISTTSQDHHTVGWLKLNSASGIPLNTKVFLTVYYRGKMQTETYLMDHTGVASFTLDTSPWRDSDKVSS